MAINVQVTFDAADPRTLGAFWRDLLEYHEDPPPPGYASWDALMDEMGLSEEERGNWYACSDPKGEGPRLFFQRVPEGKTAKNRVHLDVNVGKPRTDPPEQQRQRVDAAVARAIVAGATQSRVLDERGEYCVVMADPEGNEFCLQ